MARLFVAFPVPIEAATELAEWANQILPQASVRVLDPRSLHVTVAFYAQASEAERQSLMAAVRGSEVAPFWVRTVALRPFGASALAIELDLVIPPSSAPQSNQGFRCPDRPHVTVARMRKSFSGAIRIRNVPHVEFELDQLALYESHLDPGGSRYEIIARSPRPPGDTPPGS